MTDQDRGQDRRQGQAVFYDAIADRRRPGYDQRGRAAPRLRLRGAIRPGVNDETPAAERRRVPEGGTE